MASCPSCLCLKFLTSPAAWAIASACAHWRKSLGWALSAICRVSPLPSCQTFPRCCRCGVGCDRQGRGYAEQHRERNCTQDARPVWRQYVPKPDQGRLSVSELSFDLPLRLTCRHSESYWIYALNSSGGKFQPDRLSVYGWLWLIQYLVFQLLLDWLIVSLLDTGAGYAGTTTPTRTRGHISQHTSQAASFPIPFSPGRLNRYARCSLQSWSSGMKRSSSRGTGARSA